MNIINPKTGQPFDIGGLSEEPQTAHVSQVRNEFADHPSRGLTPPKIAHILDAAEQGDIIAQCDLYEDMEEKDGHIYSEMSKRKRALMGGVPWNIVAPPDATAREQAWADEVNEYLTDLPDMEDIIFDMADSIGKAFSCLELGWKRIGKKVLPLEIEFQKQRFFKLTRNQMRLRDNSTDGQDLWPFGWIVHRHKARSGYPDRAALYRTLVWPYLFKNYSVRDLAEFLEIYGLPLRVGTYPRGATKDEKATLKRAVAMIGHDASGIVPEGMMIEFKEAAKGEKDPFEYMIDWCERTESKCIVGQTLTAQADGKSSTHALGNVHLEVMRDLTVSDARQIQGTISRDLILPICLFNIPGIDPRRAPRFEYDLKECEDIKTFSEALDKLTNVGMDIPEQWAREKMGIPEAQKGDKLLRRQQPSSVQLKHAHAASCKHDDIDVVDNYLDRLDSETLSVMDGLIGPVQRLVMSAKSLDEIRDGLIELYPDNPTELGTILQQAFAAAELAGRFEVQEDV